MERASAAVHTELELGTFSRHAVKSVFDHQAKHHSVQPVALWASIVVRCFL